MPINLTKTNMKRSSGEVLDTTHETSQEFEFQMDGKNYLWKGDYMHHKVFHSGEFCDCEAEILMTESLIELDEDDKHEQIELTRDMESIIEEKILEHFR